MQCYACDQAASARCPRCGRSFCHLHGDTQCAGCRASGVLLTSPLLFRSALLLLALSLGLGLWHLVAWPAFPAPAQRGPVNDTVTSIPSEKKDAASAATVQSERSDLAVASPTPSPTPTRARQRYIVQQGDSLVAIAAEFNTTVAAVVEANNLPDPDTLRIGQELIIP